VGIISRRRGSDFNYRLGEAGLFQSMDWVFYFFFLKFVLDHSLVMSSSDVRTPWGRYFVLSLVRGMGYFGVPSFSLSSNASS